MAHTNRPSRSGFTLLEVMVVVVIASIIAVSVVPTLARIDDARRVAAANEVTRLLEFARARAMASGRPTGVRFARSESTVTLYTLGTDGSLTVTVGPLGTAIDPVDLEEQFGAVIEGVSVPAPTLSGGASDTTTVWFDHSGGPQSRTLSGVLVGDLDTDASVMIEDTGTVIVRARSGLVEVP